MSTIQDLFQQAQLAEAAYANFLNSAGDLLTNPDDIKAALRDTSNNMSFSAIQATEFVKQWRVVDQSPSLGFFDNGFSARTKGVSFEFLIEDQSCPAVPALN
jgi:hypothetical protein